jgi:aspartate/methionine/tyrosine aminotransferase
VNGPARRALDIEPFRVMAILAQARQLEAQGRDIIHLEIGEPDFPTPDPIVAAGIEALRAGLTHYTPALGLPALRQAIAAYYAGRQGVQIDPQRVCVTPGASGALLLAMAALFEPGDEVLMADPGYPCNRHFARLMEVRGVAIAVGPESGFQLTAEQVARHWGPRSRGVLVANPGNPTGTLLDRQELAAIHAFVREKGGWLLVDEIYHELVYASAPPSAALLGEDVIVINSFSKYWQMTGWRLGWLLVPERLVATIDNLAQNLFLAPPTIAQYAALAALAEETRPILEARKAELRARRDFLLAPLAGLGFHLPVVPHGAFYLYADVSALAGSAEALCARLLSEAGVAITPGSDFGQHRAQAHVRLAYTTALPRLAEAMARLRQAL